jgi:hypothetical protein
LRAEVRVQRSEVRGPLAIAKNFRDFFDGVPVARGGQPSSRSRGTTAWQAGEALSSKPELRVVKNLRDLLNCIPIAGRRCDAEFFLDLAEVADRLHLPAIQTQNESVLDRNDL